MLFMGWPLPKTEISHLKMTHNSHQCKLRPPFWKWFQGKDSKYWKLLLIPVSHFYLLFSCPTANFVGNYWGENLIHQIIITVFLSVFKLKVAHLLWVPSRELPPMLSPCIDSASTSTTTITKFWRALLWGHSPMFSKSFRNSAASLGVPLHENMKKIILIPRLKFWNQYLLQVRKIHVRISSFQQIKVTVIQVFFQ